MEGAAENRLLLKWSEGLLDTLFWSTEYRNAAANAPAEERRVAARRSQLTLLQQCTLRLAQGLAHLVADPDSGAITVARLQQVDRDPDRFAQTEARRIYLEQLHRDLKEEDGWRYQPAKGELWEVARDQLHKTTYFKSGARAFSQLVGALRQLERFDAPPGLDLDQRVSDAAYQLEVGFWEDIWPRIIEGRQTGIRFSKPLDDSTLMYGWLQGAARSYVSHEWKKIKKEIEARQAIDSLEQDESGEFIGASATLSVSAERVAISHLFYVETIRNGLDAVLEADTVSGVLGFLIFLMQIDEPKVQVGPDGVRLQPNQESASTIEELRNDAELLRSYLSRHCESIDCDQATLQRVIEVVGEALASAPHPVTADHVATWISRFRALFRSRAETHPSDDGGSGGDG